jgi:hypothetical protein
LGVKLKGGMYCRQCGKPVMAQKTGHGVRNTVAIGGALATAGLSLLGAKSEKWRCPICGGPATPIAQARPARPRSRKTQWRCAKNGHLLDRKTMTCPIDGSAAGWREP